MKPDVAARLTKLFNSGKRTVDDVIADARDKRSPLHSEFEWDAVKAHDIYLKDRARYLIRRWYIEQANGDEVTTTVRGAWSLPALEDDEEFVMRPVRHYYTNDEVFSSPTLTDRLLQTALSELNALRRKYRHLQQLAEVFEAIDRVQSRGSKAA